MTSPGTSGIESSDNCLIRSLLIGVNQSPSHALKGFRDFNSVSGSKFLISAWDRWEGGQNKQTNKEEEGGEGRTGTRKFSFFLYPLHPSPLSFALSLCFQLYQRTSMADPGGGRNRGPSTYIRHPKPTKPTAMKLKQYPLSWILEWNSHVLA